MAQQPEEKAKQLYLAGGWTYPALAKKFKVSERTIIRWSKANNWQAFKDAEDTASQAIASELTEELAKPISPKSVRVAMKGLDRDEILDAAIASLYAAAPDAAIKSQEAAYGQLVKIMQLRQQMEHQERMSELEYEHKKADLILKQWQINPPTPEEWAKKAVELKIHPVEAIRHLRLACGMDA